MALGLLGRRHLHRRSLQREPCCTRRGARSPVRSAPYACPRALRAAVVLERRRRLMKLIEAYRQVEREIRIRGVRGLGFRVGESRLVPATLPRVLVAECEVEDARLRVRREHRLDPAFRLHRVDELVGSERPQTGIWWLRKKPGTGPRLLGQMARGEVAISHDTFRALPSDRTHNYLRDLLAAVGVLAAYEPRIERMLPWLDTKHEPLPADQADLVRRFAHWHILRHLRNVAGQGRLTKAITDRAREQISAAIRLLAYLDERGATAATATQELLERYQTTRRLTLSSEYAFITWLRTSRINTRSWSRFGPVAIRKHA